MSYGKQCSVGVNKWWEKTENFFFFRFQPPPRLRVDEIRSKVGKKREANKAGCTKVDFPTMRRNMDLPDYCTVRARGGSKHTTLPLLLRYIPKQCRFSNKSISISR